VWRVQINSLHLCSFVASLELATKGHFADVHSSSKYYKEPKTYRNFTWFGFVFNKHCDFVMLRIKLSSKHRTLIGEDSMEPCLYESCFQRFIFLTLKHACDPKGMRTNTFTETGVQYLYLHIFPPRSQLTEEERQHWILNSRANVGLDWLYGLNCYVTYVSENTQLINVVFVYCSCVFNWIIPNK